MNEKFLYLPTTHEFLGQISKTDMYANNYTQVTNEDNLWWGYQWGEESVPLKSKIM